MQPKPNNKSTLELVPEEFCPNTYPPAVSAEAPIAILYVLGLTKIMPGHTLEIMYVKRQIPKTANKIAHLIQSEREAPFTSFTIVG